MTSFLKALASSSPTPGGGSAAALVGAVATALATMVLRIWLKRSSIPTGVQKKGSADLIRMDRLSKRFVKLMEEDSKAYAAFLRATKSGKGVNAAQRRAIEVPLSICEAAVEASRVLHQIAPRVGGYLRSDLTAADRMLQASFKAAQAMVEINMGARRPWRNS